MRQLIFVTIVMAAAAQPALARAQSEREQLELLLSSHERVPDREQLLRRSPQVERLLCEIVEKPSRRVLARTRAIGLLRFFPSAATRRVLRETIRGSARARGGLAWLELQQAVSAYAAVAGAGALEVIRPLLTHSSPDVRHSAVGALGQLPSSPRLIGLLEARLRQEPAAFVKHRLDRELQRARAR